MGVPALELLNVVSHSYIKRHGTPNGISSLSQHWLLNYQPNPTSLPAAFECYDSLAQQTLSIPMRHVITVNNSVAYHSACRAGLGIAQMPKIRALKEIKTGDLVQVLSDHLPAPMIMNLLFPHRRNIPKRVRVFAEWLTKIVHEATS